MFRNYLAAALRNLVRNWLYAGISILGLAIGMAAAIVTGLYVRDELAFDAFIPGHERLYVPLIDIPLPGQPAQTFAASPPQTADWLAHDFPGTLATTLCWHPGPTPSLRHGVVEAAEPVAWVSANFFSLLRFPTVAGDLDTAVARPGGVVITRAVARQMFSRDAPIGEILELNRAVSLTVTAVIEDLPATTNISHRVFAAARSEGAPERCLGDQPYPRKGQAILASSRTFVRLGSVEAAAAINQAMPAFVADNMDFGASGWTPAAPGLPPPSLKLIALDDLHMTSSVKDANLEQGHPRALLSLSLVAGLTLLIAGINFVNLMVARSTRRMVEVGVRKLSGAERRHLVAQFISESIIYAALALLVTTMTVDLTLPSLRTVLNRPMTFHFWRDPLLLGCSVGLCLLVGILAGAYPALVQARFRPAVALKGGWAASPAGSLVRQVLVTIQFVILISLIFAVVVIARQTHFAMNEGLRVDKDQLVMIDISPVETRGEFRFQAQSTPLCRDAFAVEIHNVPGVSGAVCSSDTALDLNDIGGCFAVRGAGSQPVQTGCSDVDFGFFELLGLRPMAGRFFTRAIPGDDLLGPPGQGGRFIFPARVVINETAVRALGFVSAADAIGQVIRFDRSDRGPSATIIGVVPDYSANLLNGRIRPKWYGLVTPRLNTLNVKLTGRDIPESLAAIDQLWKRLGEPRAPSYRFVDTFLQTAYAATLRQEMLVDGLCGIAIFLAALGLFGLSAFTAERRTKEIGVRKALGASRADILGMLMWEFARPVLWANLVAWPMAYVLMRRWLETFTYRIDLEPWMFLSASGVALAIALLTVAGHTLAVARAAPAKALRYE